jgi:hypothetical protein
MSGTAKTFTYQTTNGVDANFATEGSALELDVSQYVILDVTAASGAHAVHVVTLQLSSNAADWIDTAVAVTGTGFSEGTVNAQFARFKVTTLEGAASTVNITIQAKA